MSKTNRSRNNTHDERMAAIVKITVRMNHAQRYIASAFGNCAFNIPVFGSVYAARIPEPGRYIMAYERLNAPYDGKTVAPNCTR